MSDTDDKAALDALSAAIPPALEQFLDTARGQILRMATAEGYAAAEAGWIEERMRLPLLQRLADAIPIEEALATSYREAQRGLTVAIFEHALRDGDNAAGAFRRLVDLEFAMTKRSGDPEPSYSVALVEAGCEAAAAAANEGASIEQQIDTGFALMRELARFDPTSPPSANGGN